MDDREGQGPSPARERMLVQQTSATYWHLIHAHRAPEAGLADCILGWATASQILEGRAEPTGQGASSSPRMGSEEGRKR